MKYGPSPRGNPLGFAPGISWAQAIFNRISLLWSQQIQYLLAVEARHAEHLGVGGAVLLHGVGPGEHGRDVGGEVTDVTLAEEEYQISPPIQMTGLTDEANAENNCSENNEILISCMVFHFMPPSSVGGEIVLFSVPVKTPLGLGAFKALSLHRISSKPAPQLQSRSCTSPELVELLFPLLGCSEVSGVPV